MTPKEKAVELVEKFKEYVHGYVGSSMLTNYEYPEQILSQAKKCASMMVDEIIKSNPMIEFGCTDSGTEYKENTDYWYDVKEEISKL